MHNTNSLAIESLLSSQTVMKSRSDHVWPRLNFDDKVLPLLPMPGYALSAGFIGFYKVHKFINATDCVIASPGRRWNKHINMIKSYVTCETTTAALPGESRTPDTLNVLVVSEPS